MERARATAGRVSAAAYLSSARGDDGGTHGDAARLLCAALVEAEAVTEGVTLADVTAGVTEDATRGRLARRTVRLLAVGTACGDVVLLRLPSLAPVGRIAAPLGGRPVSSVCALRPHEHALDEPSPCVSRGDADGLPEAFEIALVVGTTAAREAGTDTTPPWPQLPGAAAAGIRGQADAAESEPERDTAAERERSFRLLRLSLEPPARRPGSALTEHDDDELAGWTVRLHAQA